MIHSPPHTDRLLGRTLGDFRLLQLAGQGSVSRVYRALQISLGRIVALKVFQEELLMPGQLVERVQREAEYLAQFEHPNILPVYAAGQEEDLHWLALRYIEGGSFTEWLGAGRAPRAVCAILRDVAAGLALVHARGGVHRDLKPSNVLVEDGVGILADFGLARLLQETTITQAGSVLGTPMYMAPELWRQEKADPRSDVYSFGVLLYESLTGKHPYLTQEANSRMSPSTRERVLALMQGDSPSLDPERIPAEVDRIARRCVAFDPDRRFADAQALGAEMDRVDWPPCEEARVPTARRASRLSSLELGEPVAAVPAPPVAVTDTAEPEGTPFGRYRLRGELGKGGMGVVYRAWDPALHREVALKVLLAGQLASREQVERFEREARAAAGLRHPGIIPVHEVGEADGRHYFTMDLVEGSTLRDVLRTSLVPLQDLLALLVQVARAVHHANECGIVHRDLKPANVFVEARGRAVVGDFGLARAASESDGATASGAILGTPAYMSPEQVRGEPRLDGRSDVYSLGAILYEVLVGRPPFTGDSAVEILPRVLLEDPVPPSRKQTRVARDLNIICLKALEKDPARRYPSAAELADDIDRFLRGEPILASPPSLAYRLGRSFARHRWSWLAISTSVLLVASVAGLLLVRRQRDLSRADALRPIARAACERGDLDGAIRVFEEIAALDPDDAEMGDAARDLRKRRDRISKLQVRAQQETPRDRVRTLTEIIELNPADPSSWLLRGEARIKLRQWEEAIADLQRSAALSPGEARPHFLLFGIYSDARVDEKRALEELEMAAQCDPTGSLAWIEKGWRLGRRAEWAAAVAAYDEALRMNPGDPGALSSRGACRRRMGDVDGALSDYAAAIKSNEGYANAYYNRALLFHDLHRFEEAQADLRQVLALTPQEPRAYSQLGTTLHGLKRFVDAEAAYSMAILLDPRNPDHLTKRAVLRVNVGRVEAAIEDVQSALSLDPRNVEALFTRGYAEFHGGDPSAAERDFRGALAIDATHDRARNMLGLLLATAGRPQEALDLLDVVVRNSPTNAEARVNRALALRNLDRNDEAETDYRAAVDANPGLAEAWWGLGQLLCKRGVCEEAEEAFERAISLGARDAYFSRGSCRVRRERWNEALDDLRRAVELDSDPTRRANAREAAEKIQRKLEGK